MVEKASGLILRKRRLTESSLIVHWLTPTVGRLSTVAKGALRPKSVLRGKLDLFYEADFSFSRSRRSDLHTLAEVRTHEMHPELRSELGYLQQACYCSELIEQTTETETPVPEVYELMRSLLGYLPHHKPLSHSVFAFELKLLSILGLQPDPKVTTKNAGTKCVIEALESGPWDTIGRLRLSVPQETEINQFLNGFIIYHLGRIPREREAAIRG
jgi:DNA repair protein RecO (recombination protein O)